jgi:LDH2 family malate/lactate/ureidoglycolate dehydrogenase
VTPALETVIAADSLRDYARAVLDAAGMGSRDAAITADAMVWADLRGLDAHGVGHKLPQCLARIRAGGTDPAPILAPLVDTETMVVFDAATAWGQVAATRAMQWAIGKARKAGLGVAIAHNMSSAAAMGYYPSLAVGEQMIGIVINDGPALMPPWGGSTRVLGNMGHAIGVPAGRHPPLLFDSSLTVMSTGEMDVLHERGEMLPEGVLLDEAGRPTRDPGAWVNGLLLPAGGHRGYGLALMFEVLTGVLAGGARFGPDVGSPNAAAEPQGVSLLAVAIDPGVSMPFEMFAERVDQLIDHVHASPPADGTERVFVPGERGFLIAEQRGRDGITFSARRLEELRGLGDGIAVTL